VAESTGKICTQQLLMALALLWTRPFPPLHRPAPPAANPTAARSPRAARQQTAGAWTPRCHAPPSNNCLRMSGASAASARCAHALAHLLAMVPKVPQSLIGLPYDRFFAW